MDPTRHDMIGTTTGAATHAHLLVAESGGLVTMESPEEVMAEVAFRATCVSTLMEKMFEELKNRDCFRETDEG
jgi:hypothetical protein